MAVAKLIVFFSSLLASLTLIQGHGKMIDPLNRSSMWRSEKFKKLVEANYQDNENFCGGFSAQHSAANRGRCGTCGDNYADKAPRKNENGGIYGRGHVVSKYKMGKKIKAKIELSANHKGYFKFAICKLANPSAVETEKCFDKYPLRVIDKNGKTADRYHVAAEDRTITIEVLLPKDLKCNRCVLRWHYSGGNNWGLCRANDQSSGKVGCGPQETFRNCADIAIE